MTLHPENKIMTPNMIDKFISAEIPNNDNKDLQKLVIKHMLHGPHTNKSPCIIKDQPLCKKKFPKQFCESTILKDIEYRRQDNSVDNTGPQKKKTVGSGMETILFFCIFSR